MAVLRGDLVSSNLVRPLVGRGRVALLRDGPDARVVIAVGVSEILGAPPEPRFDRRVGFWAAALLQCLPATARTTADGLTEALFLLLAATALLMGARALRTGRASLFALCGLCGGLGVEMVPRGLRVVGVEPEVTCAMKRSPRHEKQS